MSFQMGSGSLGGTVLFQVGLCTPLQTMSLLLNKGMFWVSEERLVDQADTICRNSWMTELEIEELERNLTENDSYQDKERSYDDAGSNLGEELRDNVVALEADEEIGNLEKEEVAIINRIQDGYTPYTGLLPVFVL